AKKDHAYNYQLYSLISEAMEIVMFIVHTISKLCSGMMLTSLGFAGFTWYRKFYPLMIYSTRISIPLLDTSLTTSLFLAMCAAADRVFVLTKPAAYQKINHRLHQRLVLLACAFAGVVTNGDNCFLYALDYNETTEIYTVVNNKEYSSNLIVIGWTLMSH